MDVNGNWLPGERKEVKVNSLLIPSIYASYPVQEASVNLIIYGEDQINDSTVKGIFQTIDITQTWQRESRRMKEMKSRI